MREKWAIERWDTPVSDIQSVAMVSLTDTTTLTVVLEAPRQPERPRWAIEFSRYPAYRSVLEEYRLKLWAHLDKTGQRCGNTFLVTNSSWISDFRADEPLLEVHSSGVQHYVICTEDDVVEVLSCATPKITELGSTPAGTQRAGKSQVFYMPAGGAAAEKEIRQSSGGCSKNEG